MLRATAVGSLVALACVIASDAAKAAGSTDAEAVAAAMKEKGPFPTVLGDMSFDEKGDPKLPGYIMYEWKKGPDGKYSYFPQGM